MPAQEPSIDEIQWRSPDIIANEFGAIHSNTVLFYFARSPFFNETSNNAVLYSQALHNQAMFPLLNTRESFEGHLRTMSGLEFMVVEEPAETGPGYGTGVWVINKQLRKKIAGEEDDIQVLATYFVVGENIYQAPALADILNSRIALVTAYMRSIIDTADSIRTWTASQGSFYVPPLAQKDPTQLTAVTPSQTTSTPQDPSDTKLMQQLALESLAIHMRHGTDYINENPITGEPGKFQLSSTGRTAAAAQAARNAQLAAQAAAKNSGASGLGVAVAAVGKDGKKEEGKKELGKEKKAGQKPKKKRSKSTASTPAAL